MAIKEYYRGFIIEKIDKELYSIKRMNGGKWSVCILNHPIVSVENIRGTIDAAKKYINSIEDFYEQ